MTDVNAEEEKQEREEKQEEKKAPTGAEAIGSQEDTVQKGRRTRVYGCHVFRYQRGRGWLLGQGGPRWWLQAQGTTTAA